MANPYPNNSGNTIYTHLRSLSNMISDFGKTITFLHFSTPLSSQSDPTMPSFNHSGSIRHRFLRIISFGRYSSSSADDLEPLTKTHDGSRRYSAPADLEEQSSRPLYTAHQSPQSSESAQTTIVHEIPAGKPPFSISGLRDQYRGRVISDAEFDTPPSLEAAQETVRPAEPQQFMSATRPFARSLVSAGAVGYDGSARRPAPAPAPWPATREPVRLRHEISYLQCNVCSRVLEYNQIHCPGCAARTLRHISGDKEDPYTNGKGNVAGSRPLQPKKQRQNEQPEATTEESSWNTQGLEAGTVEESWTTTTNDAVGASSTSPKHTQDSPSQSTEIHEPHSRYCCCCCGTGVTLINHCHPNAPSIHATGAVIFVCSAPKKSTYKFWKRDMPRHRICYRIWGGEDVDVIGEADQVCKCGEGKQEEASDEKTAWWMRWSKWFCCC